MAECQRCVEQAQIRHGMETEIANLRERCAAEETQWTPERYIRNATEQLDDLIEYTRIAIGNEAVGGDALRCLAGAFGRLWQARCQLDMARDAVEAAREE